jgi:hypothetical protein
MFAIEEPRVEASWPGIIATGSVAASNLGIREVDIHSLKEMGVWNLGVGSLELELIGLLVSITGFGAQSCTFHIPCECRL